MNFKTFWNQLTKDEKESYAKAVGSKPVYMNLISLGHSRPSINLADKMEKATKGKVSFDEILRPEKAIS